MLLSSTLQWLLTLDYSINVRNNEIVKEQLFSSHLYYNPNRL